MRTIEQLEQQYQKEIALAEKHKKAAVDIRKQIETQQGKVITQKINALNMNGAEYGKFIKLLSSSKKTVLQAADQVLGVQERGGTKPDEKEET